MKKHLQLPTQTVDKKLLKYDPPIIITTSIESKEKQKLLGKPTSPQGYGVDESEKIDNPCLDAGIQRTATQELLDIIFPPKNWNELGLHWRQSVCNDPATRSDMIVLEAEFNKLLKESQAQNTGVCPIRRKLFIEMLDEIIRQVIVTSSTRGLLLVKIRDEYAELLEISRAIYASCSAYGMRKALIAEAGKTAVEKKTLEISKEQEELQKSIRELDERMEYIERKWTDKRIGDEKRHFEEVQHIKRTNDKLKQQLESLVQPSRKYIDILYGDQYIKKVESESEPVQRPTEPGTTEQNDEEEEEEEEAEMEFKT